jgi:peptidoglycan/LPS O-acetylase OafA/YrhL
MRFQQHDFAGYRRPVREFFRTVIWEPFAESIGEVYRKQYYPLGYTPALDGLRGLMTVGVIFYHTLVCRLIHGTVLFMDVFFVMSGYFITSLLMRDIQRDGCIRYGQFYRRRFARILPPLLVMMLAYLLFRLAFVGPFRDALVEALIVLSYMSNWGAAFNFLDISSYMHHTWSLAVEEQFYLLWPITFALLVRTCGVRWRLVYVIVAIALAVWGWRIGLAMTGASPWRLLAGLDTHADALMLGCALGVALKLAPAGTYPKVEGFLPKLAWPCIIGSLGLIFFFPPFWSYFYYYLGSVVCGALPGAVVVILLVRTSGTVLHRILERPEIVFLGKIFYGMYLWHLPIVLLMWHFSMSTVVRFSVGFPLTILLATVSYAYIERHFMRVRSDAVGRPKRFLEDARADAPAAA